MRRIVLIVQFMSSDSGILLAASYTLVITGFDLATGSTVGEYEIQNTQANRIVAHRDETVFFAAGYSYVFLYDVQKKGKKASQMFVAHEGNVTDVDLLPTTIVTSGDDKTLKTWDRRSLQAGLTLKTKSPNNSVQFLSGGDFIVSGNEAGTVELYDLRSSTSLVTVKISEKPVRSIAVSPDGRRVIAASQDGRTVCYLFENKTITEQYRIQSHNEIQLRTVISPDGQLFATTAANNTARVWYLANGDMKQSLVASDERIWIWDAAFTSDASKLCTGGSDGFCRMFDCENGRMERTYPQAEKCVSCIGIMRR